MKNILILLFLFSLFNACNSNKYQQQGNWGRIEKYLSKNSPDKLSLLQKGATEAQINELELIIGEKLPDDFIQFYKIHNGQKPYTNEIISYKEILCLDRIAEELTLQREFIKDTSWIDDIPNMTIDGLKGIPDKGIKDNYFNPLWIPFIADGFGDFLCIDLDPTAEGKRGQVIWFYHDNPKTELVAESFSEWLSQFVEQLENGEFAD